MDGQAVAVADPRKLSKLLKSMAADMVDMVADMAVDMAAVMMNRLLRSFEFKVCFGKIELKVLLSR